MAFRDMYKSYSAIYEEHLEITCLEGERNEELLKNVLVAGHRLGRFCLLVGACPKKKITLFHALMHACKLEDQCTSARAVAGDSAGDVGRQPPSESDGSGDVNGSAMSATPSPFFVCDADAWSLILLDAALELGVRHAVAPFV